MQTPNRETLLHVYEIEVKAAYDELLERFLFNRSGGVETLRQIAGRCGAQVSAAHKRCKRELVFAALKAARDSGLDITPTVAEHLCTRLIGRGVALRAALESFGTHGRTAATKSTVGQTDLAGLEAELVPQVQSLIDEMTVIRERYKDEYEERAREAVKGSK
ncbi:hypothetical protein IYR97_22925 (plasmid) [Pseudomonas fulva]|uniref:hypothetical protein n=1 Tax=Pseudomonas fulva TaxID=47880 RepID=UPI0018ABB66D|nr:hypothetical protein [Pseudomonas fulva]QPH46401.1 hypothetical protein IYR97_22925 [Pseudomonas fulva]